MEYVKCKRTYQFKTQCKDDLIDDLISTDKPDVILLQEHWLTPAKLGLFESHFVNYFAFGCSAMLDCIETGMLRGRPYRGVICLVAKRL